ncbi:aminoacyl-tRNA hydrolase [Elusimicrobiota bacterium]
MSEIKLVVGLGNPGREYTETRHNIGFKVIDLFLKDCEENLKNWNDIADVLKIKSLNDLIIAKPQQYMNNSGFAVKKIADYFRISNDQILVIIDDFSIPLGTLRLRSNGSSGGHNGLSSVIEHFGTPNIARLRLGVGPVPEKRDPADFVLSKFKKEENETATLMLKNASDVLNNILKIGIEKAASKISNVEQAQP